MYGWELRRESRAGGVAVRLADRDKALEPGCIEAVVRNAVTNISAERSPGFWEMARIFRVHDGGSGFRRKVAVGDYSDGNCM